VLNEHFIDFIKNSAHRASIGGIFDPLPLLVCMNIELSSAAISSAILKWLSELYGNIVVLSIFLPFI